MDSIAIRRHFGPTWALRLSDNPGQAVAIANLAFNLGVALLFLPLTGWMGRYFAPPGTPIPSAQNAAI